MTELSKTYNPAEVEQKWYKFWEENGLFEPNPLAQEPFTIVIPPPNVTGSLHMGHALDNSLQDVLIRYKRMQGFRALWVPGTDHAGIATQNVVERELKKEGKRKEDLGRDAFLERVWAWKKEYGGRITTQLRRLGASCDWKHERFTMDEGLSRAVTKEFVTLYNEGLVYRGKRIINWCPRCQTALSDIETEYQNKKGKLWHIKYRVEGQVSSSKEEFIVVATTRPETMLGDTAVAVNPKDERYKHLIGKELVLPLVGRKIPIIKDDFVDPEFGTGAVKVTPAHDSNDYMIGERHNLPKINVLTTDAKIDLRELREAREEKIVAGLEGLDRFKARDEIVKLLEEKGFVDKIEDYDNSVGHCYRCKTAIEPYLSDQWFIKIKPLAEVGIKVVEEGQIKFVPERWTKVYLQWMMNLRDWCISRQLWWGHRIPVWYRNEETYVGETAPTGDGWIQDPDVFDTWFSSALWPFSTLGWPDETEDLKKHYPTSVLVTGYDIITFWVSRMIMSGMHFMKKPPFHTVFIHGLIRDITGKKMSKSLGNVIDPIEVIDHAGADALRFALISMVTGGGQDIKLAEEKITEARNFANKIWNVTRFALLTMEPENERLGSTSRNREVYSQVPKSLEMSDKWILSRLNKTIIQTTGYLDNLQMGEAAKLLYDFIWSEFCDWYVELSKKRLYGDDQSAKQDVQWVLYFVMENILKLLHPFMPFETEELFQRLHDRETSRPQDSIMAQRWPKADEKMLDESAEKEISETIEIIRAIRNLRASLNIAPGAKIKLIVDKDVSDDIRANIIAIGKISEIEKSDLYPPHTIVTESAGITIGIPVEGLVDFEKEASRIKNDYDKLKSAIEQVRTRLANEDFLKNATEGSIQKEKDKLEDYSGKIKILDGYLKAL